MLKYHTRIHCKQQARDKGKDNPESTKKTDDNCVVLCQTSQQQQTKTDKTRDKMSRIKANHCPRSHQLKKAKEKEMSHGQASHHS